MAWQWVRCSTIHLQPPSILHDKLHPQHDQDVSVDRTACKVLEDLQMKNIWRRDDQHQLVLIYFLLYLDVFCLNSLTLWCQSKCAKGAKRPLGSWEVWSPRATYKHQGAVPFPELRKLAFEEALWVRFLSFPLFWHRSWLECRNAARGITSVASHEHFLTSTVTHHRGEGGQKRRA